MVKKINKASSHHQAIILPRTILNLSSDVVVRPVSRIIERRLWLDSVDPNIVWASKTRRCDFIEKSVASDAVIRFVSGHQRSPVTCLVLSIVLF